MNKGDLVDLVAERLGESRVQAQRVVEVVLSSMTDGLRDEEKVVLSGFGTFRRKFRKGRIGRNPATNEPIQIPGGHTVSFTPSKSLKEAMSVIEVKPAGVASASEAPAVAAAE